MREAQMAKEQLDRVVRHIRSLVEDPATSGLTDGELLARGGGVHLVAQLDG